MALTSSTWTIELLVYVAEHSGSTHLRRFLAACYKQINILSPCYTYDDAKFIFAKLAIAEALYKSPPNNISAAYSVQVAQLTKGAAVADPQAGISATPINATSISCAPGGSSLATGNNE
jgi:hypothetical protein